MTTSASTYDVDDAYLEYLRHVEAGRRDDAADLLARSPELRAVVADSTGVVGLLRAFGQAERREPDLRTDERFIGDYELLERVGGNMGIVYKARQISLPREVAVKLLLHDGPGDRDRFRAEAEAMARLRHPNVVRIIEVSRGDEAPFFSMEWHPNGTLQDHLARYAPDPVTAVRVVVEVARAVHFGHQRGVLHRDLKPSNILLDEADRPQVADFGLAVLVADNPRYRLGGGTPEYMAPEQRDGEVTVSTDVYGLGGVLFALLTGRPPGYPTHNPPSAPAGLNKRVDADLNAVCLKCLARDPATRYGSAEALAADLDRWLRGEPVAALPLGLLGRAARGLRSAREALEIAAIGSFLMLHAVFVFLTNSAAYLLLQAGAAEPWLWTALYASYLPLLAMGLRDQFRAAGPRRPGVRHLWAIGLGHAVGSLAAFTACRLAAGPDPVRWLGEGCIAVAGMNALAFIAFGSLFSGRLYLLGPVWAAAAIAMGANMPHAPLIYAGVMAGCSAMTGAHLKALADESAKN